MELLDHSKVPTHFWVVSHIVSIQIEQVTLLVQQVLLLFIFFVVLSKNSLQAPARQVLRIVNVDGIISVFVVNQLVLLVLIVVFLVFSTVLRQKLITDSPIEIVRALVHIVLNLAITSVERLFLAGTFKLDANSRQKLVLLLYICLVDLLTSLYLNIKVVHSGWIDHNAVVGVLIFGLLRLILIRLTSKT